MLESEIIIHNMASILHFIGPCIYFFIFLILKYLLHSIIVNEREQKKIVDKFHQSYCKIWEHALSFWKFDLIIFFQVSIIYALFNIETWQQNLYNTKVMIIWTYFFSDNEYQEFKSGIKDSKYVTWVFFAKKIFAARH